jgi:hypothetical protein
VLSRIGDELRIAWMIDGFHADNRAHQLRTVLANVLDQFGLDIGAPRLSARSAHYRRAM